MGYHFTENATKEEVIEDILKPRRDYYEGRRVEGVECTAIAHRLVGDSLWVVRSVTLPLANNEKDTRLWIGLYLLANRGYGWGYKEIDEASGPADLTCPVEFFDLVPNPDDPLDCIQEWRATVRANAYPDDDDGEVLSHV